MLLNRLVQFITFFVVLALLACGGDDEPTPTSTTASGEATATDADGDGLEDSWETSGIYVDDDDVIDLALGDPPFNANPQHKDIFVEIDYMPHQELADGVQQSIIERFARAPVANPDGQTGITLHLMVDEQLPRTDPLFFALEPDQRGDSDLDDFDDLKLGGTEPCDGYFGTAIDRDSSNCHNVLEARRRVFRYGILGEQLARSDGKPSTATGIAELPGNDFLVTLGTLQRTSDGYYRYDIDTDPDDTTIRKVFPVRVVQLATLMHELGHTLDLHHGGRDDINCKPNYLSVMSYIFQFPFLPNYDGSYSNIELPELNEARLDERMSVGGESQESTVFGLRKLSKAGPAGADIDWDGDASLEGDTHANINEIESIGCDTGGETSDTQVLQGSNDWEHLDYNFRDSDDYADGVHGSALDLDEITIDQIIEFAREFDFDEDGRPHIVDACPFVPDIEATDADCPDVSATPTATAEPDASSTPSPTTTGNMTPTTPSVPVDCASTGNPARTDLDQDGILDACDPDIDGDGTQNSKDNCPVVPNPDQRDRDSDGDGDACEGPDTDDDGIPDATDNCVRATNPDQADLDEDATGDLCDSDDDGDRVFDTVDNCPTVFNADQIDFDRDGIGDVCDGPDDDADQIPDTNDNCRTVFNPSQIDIDRDGEGDACDSDDDGDRVVDTSDNCRTIANQQQEDFDDDGVGDACDGTDDDSDGVPNDVDNCRLEPNPSQQDYDNDGSGDACDPDADGDRVEDVKDNCLLMANPDQRDADADQAGDACDADDDNDAVADTNDNCPMDANPDQLDTDDDGRGNICDGDDDDDGIADSDDNCASIMNASQFDRDDDGYGDACDDSDADSVMDADDNCWLISNLDQADSDRDGTGDACELACLSFDSIPNGTEYAVGDAFSSDDDVTMTVGTFQWSSGTPTNGGHVTVDDGEILPNNANLDIDFGRTVNEIQFSFVASGGNLNVRINDAFANIGAFSELGDGIGGTSITIDQSAGSDSGRLVIVGAVEVFAIGGQELTIRNVCYR